MCTLHSVQTNCDQNSFPNRYRYFEMRSDFEMKKVSDCVEDRLDLPTSILQSSVTLCLYGQESGNLQNLKKATFFYFQAYLKWWWWIDIWQGFPAAPPISHFQRNSRTLEYGLICICMMMKMLRIVYKSMYIITRVLEALSFWLKGTTSLSWGVLFIEVPWLLASCQKRQYLGC